MPPPARSGLLGRSALEILRQCCHALQALKFSRVDKLRSSEGCSKKNEVEYSAFYGIPTNDILHHRSTVGHRGQTKTLIDNGPHLRPCLGLEVQANASRFCTFWHMPACAERLRTMKQALEMAFYDAQSYTPRSRTEIPGQHLPASGSRCSRDTPSSDELRGSLGCFAHA